MNASLQTTDITKLPINVTISIGFKTTSVAASKPLTIINKEDENDYQ
jgi:hypothetical protein